MNARERPAHDRPPREHPSERPAMATALALTLLLQEEIAGRNRVRMKIALTAAIRSASEADEEEHF